MTQGAFQALLTDFFRATKSTHVQVLPGAGHCRCFGLDMALYYDHKADPWKVHAYMDFGTVAPARQHEVFRALLLRSLRFGVAHHAVLGVDESSGRIVLVARIRFDRTFSGERMAAILLRLIRQAGVWSVPKPALRVGAGKTRSVRRPS